MSYASLDAPVLPVIDTRTAFGAMGGAIGRAALPLARWVGFALQSMAFAALLWLMLTGPMLLG